MKSFDLIVLMIEDSGLLSSLVARLTSLGENVITVSRILSHAELERLADQNAVLIAEKSMLDDNLTAILANTGWRHVIILNGHSPDEPGGRPLRMRREDALSEVTVALNEWRNPKPVE